MDGVRSSLTDEVKDLRSYVKAFIEGEDCDMDDLQSAMDAVICSVNSFNCLSMDDVVGFNVLDREIPLVDENSL